MSKLVLIGEAPGGSGTEVQPALEGLVGRRLAKMMDVSDAVYMSSTRRKNIFETPDEGQRWSPWEARQRAIRMAGTFRQGDRVVLLGARVAKAFGLEDQPHFTWISAWRIMTSERFQYALVPHPSGRNRLYNDPAVRERASEFLAEAVRDR